MLCIHIETASVRVGHELSQHQPSSAGVCMLEIDIYCLACMRHAELRVMHHLNKPVCLPTVSEHNTKRIYDS